MRSGLLKLPGLWAAVMLCAALGLAYWLWGLGGMEGVARWAAAWQREVQTTMAQALRSLKAGEAGALIGLWSMAFAYGFFHAAGPGHGKLVIGGYGMARRVPMRRLAALALVSSLAQAATAVVLVAGGIAILGWGRSQLTEAADRYLEPVSYGAIAAIGLWLMTRGARKIARLWAARRAQDARRGGVSAKGHDGQDGHEGHDAQDHLHAHSHTHSHPHTHRHADGGSCDCGHKHGPDIEEVMALRSLRDAAALVAAVAVRPCTGAVFLLILTWKMDLFAAGVAGAFIMGLGTASVTIAVAVAAALMREGALARLAGGAAARAIALAELLAGAMIAVIAGQMVLRLI
ncbi:hypothetical protein [Litorivita sp. NS0012-18]|uniref:nickel/cobalt transporter n=1 Tax=Litorivita sp. NS0012-18 TaxID=3127655 RepID=UPI00310C3EA6